MKKKINLILSVAGIFLADPCFSVWAVDDSKNKQPEPLKFEKNIEFSQKIVSLGDVFILKIELNTNQPIILQKPEIVWNKSILEKEFSYEFQQTRDFYQYRFIYHLIAFELGKVKMNPWSLIIRSANMPGEKSNFNNQKIEINDLEVEVKGFNLTGSEPLKSSFATIDFLFDWWLLLLYLILFLVLGAIILYLIIRAFTYYRSQEKDLVAVDLRLPQQYFFDELQLVRQQLLNEEADLKLLLSQIVRVFYRYLEKKFQLNLTEKTVSHIRDIIAELDLNDSTRKQLFAILPIIERVKYAPSIRDVLLKMQEDFINQMSLIVNQIESELPHRSQEALK